MAVDLDRMTVEEAGPNPQKLAGEIHRQLGHRRGAVPIGGIVRALDIVEVRSAPLDNLEGALVTLPERGYGAILVNSRSGRRRARFTMAHELGHFLKPFHRPTAERGFECSRHDLNRWSQNTGDRHRRQEAEANAFAIELLAPERLARPWLDAEVDLAQVLELSTDLEISRQAAARRYVELHEASLAIVFSTGGRFWFATRSRAFPLLSLGRDDPMPALPDPAGGALSGIEEADPLDWLRGSPGADLFVQTLHQQNGHAMTLLWAENGEEH